MRRNRFGFCLIWVSFLLFTAFAWGALDVPPQDGVGFVWGSSPDPDPLRDSLEGKRIVVRIYADWRNEPAAFALVPAEVHDLQFSVKASLLGDDAVLAALGEDQAYPELQKALRGKMQTWIGKNPDSAADAPRFSLDSLRSEAKAQTIRFSDALEQPLVGATVVATLSAKPDGSGARVQLDKLQTSQEGSIVLPDFSGPLPSASCRVDHPDYGIAQECRLSYGSEHRFSLPLVKTGTPAAERALRGVVLTPEGEPIPHALVACNHIRTLGEGLINCRVGGVDCVRTDSAGRFRLYLPGNNQKEEFGELIPPRSRYQVRVEAPDDLDLLPLSAAYLNDEDVAIRMLRGERFHTFRFETADGAAIDLSVIQNFNMALKIADQVALHLDRETIERGTKIPDGIVQVSQVSLRSNATPWEFPDLEVNAESPDELVFRAKMHLSYTGRVVNGVTGEGIAGAVVFSLHSLSDTGLEDLTQEQWAALHALPPKPDAEDPALQPLKDMYRMACAVRTGPDGRFRFEPSERLTDHYAFAAAEEHFLGYQRRTTDLKPDAQGNVAIPDLPLFPAVRMLVTLKNADSSSVFSPEWVLSGEAQPAWTKRLEQEKHATWGWCIYSSWLKPNEQEAFLAPAGLRYRVTLSAPCSEELLPVRIDRDFEPRQGETIDLGEQEVQCAWAALVRVLDPAGNPLEGVPVRYGVCGANGKVDGYSVAHNTDRDGLARFYVAPGSQGLFRVSDFPHDSGSRAPAAEVAVEIPLEPIEVATFTIQLGIEQVQALFPSDAGATPSARVVDQPEGEGR